MKISDKQVKIFLASYFTVFIASAVMYAKNPALKWLIYVLSAITVLALGTWLLRGVIKKFSR